MKSYYNKDKRGSGYLVVLLFATMLLILFGIFGRLRTSHHLLQSKDVRRFIASNLGEAALNCIVAELNANRAYNTHLHYYPYEMNKQGWYKPIKKRDSLLGKIDNMTINGVNQGIYSGYTDYGEFKAKFAMNYGSRENSSTKALRESEMYTRVEIVVKVKGGAGAKDETYRKITALLERRYPATEYLLFDGEMLDIGGFGPYLGVENQLRRSRLYGYHWITFNSAGGACKGSEIVEGEKIETPGLIRALIDTDLEFSNHERHKLTKENDSIHVTDFQDFDGYIVDGPHGAHPIKFTRLPKERIKKTAETYKKSYGVIIDDKTLPVSKYINPYDSSTKYYDLDFAGYKAVAVPRDEDERSTRDSSSDDDKDDEESDVAGDAEEEVEDVDSTEIDDPEIIKQHHGRKILVYSEVPLRIWGCPDKSITIYSTKDIVIAGDFNQNPETSQVYKSRYYQDYKKVLRNGRYNNKVGAMIMSEGRIFIDVSQPSKFAKNEIKPYFLYCLAMNLHPSSLEIEEELKHTLCPADPRERDTIFGVSSSVNENGLAEPRFGTMAFLYNFPEVNSGGSYEANIEDLQNFFMPSTVTLNHSFGIKDSKVREDIIEYIKHAIRLGGDLTKEEQDRIFEMAWKQALIEEENDYDPTCGPSGLMSGLFEEAVKNDSDGLFVPEITINATLISSCRRASNWKVGNSSVKIQDEIGDPEVYLKKPGFIIQRIYGGDIRIGRAKPEYFVDGTHSGKNILRRRIWDKTNLSNRDFKPLEAPAVHNILTITDEQISSKEYNNFKG